MDPRDPIQLDYAKPAPGVPTALKVVAWIFIVSGVLTIIETLIMLAHGRLNLNTGVLGVFIGPGLLRFSRGWRTCALVLLWIGMIFAPVILLAMLFSSRATDVNLFGLPFGAVPGPIGFAFALPLCILVFWEYRVLVRQDILQRFGLPPR